MSSKNIFLTAVILISFLSLAVSAKAAELPSAGTTPDSPLYVFKTWKESIQTFFTFGLENKARQYLRLAEVRLAEYQKMMDKGKTKVAEKTLVKYERQLNRALEKAEELKQKGKDVKDISQKIEEKIIKHTEVLEQNLQKVPEAGKKGLGKALDSSGKAIEKIKEKLKEPKDETAGWKTYRNEEFGFEVKYPASFTGVGDASLNSVLGSVYNPLRGIYVGYLVFVVLDNKTKEKEANDYLNKYLDIAKNPTERIEGRPHITCEIVEVPNTFIDISAVNCGPAGGIYALIRGDKYNIFVDGYSGGYADVEKLKSLSIFNNPNPPEDEKLLLSTFRFISQ